MPHRLRKAIRIEAKWLLLRHLAAYRHQSYEKLVEQIDDVDHLQVHGDSGRSYHVEVLFIWDDKPGGSVRIIATIDAEKTHLSSVCPLSADTLVHHPPPDYDETWVNQEVPGFRAATRMRRAITLLIVTPLFIFVLWRLVNLRWDAWATVAIFTLFAGLIAGCFWQNFAASRMRCPQCGDQIKADEIRLKPDEEITLDCARCKVTWRTGQSMWNKTPEGGGAGGDDGGADGF